MSAGTRSGVNWIRANEPPTTLARVSTASVLATPGTPSSRQCPRASSATNIRSIIRSWPTITRLTSNNLAWHVPVSTRGGTGRSGPQTPRRWEPVATRHRDTPRKGHAAPLDTGGRFVVNISPSPGGFPRGRPALKFLSGVRGPDPPLLRQRLRRTGRLGPALEQSEAAHAGTAQDLACL